MFRLPAALLITLAVPVGIVALAVQLLATAPAVRAAYSRPGFPPPASMDVATRDQLAIATTDFVAGRSQREALEALRLPAEGSGGDALYAPGEVEHLADVRRLIGRLRMAGIVAGLVLAVAWLGPWRSWAARPTARGGWLTLGMVALLGVGIAVAWSWLFTTFHELLFPPGTWQFSADSGLIRLFPGTFWSDAAIALAGGTAIGGLLVASAARRVGNGRNASRRGRR